MNDVDTKNMPWQVASVDSFLPRNVTCDEYHVWHIAYTKSASQLGEGMSAFATPPPTHTPKEEVEEEESTLTVARLQLNRACTKREDFFRYAANVNTTQESTTRASRAADVQRRRWDYWGLTHVRCVMTRRNMSAPRPS